MHGGNRQGAGRKPLNNKKESLTIYLDEAMRSEIEQLKLPASKSFSDRCRFLLSLGIKKVKKSLSTEPDVISFIDLFCGMGGIRIGFEQALNKFDLKGQCVFSSDVKKAAIAAYEYNFSENPECDITKVNEKNIPDFDFLLAGFPCQAFSQAGLGLGFDDTRGTLFFDIVRILKEKKPLGFILENVEGLVSHDKGKTFSIIKNTLKKIGYNIQYNVLDSQNFGLAQTRKRIYIIGLLDVEVQALSNFSNKTAVLKDVIDYEVGPEESEFSKKLFKHYDLEEVYGKSIKDKRGGSNNIHSWSIGLRGEVSKDESELLEKLLLQRRNKKWADRIGIQWMDGMPLTAEMIAEFFDHPKLLEMLNNLVNKGYLSYEYPRQRVGNRRVPDPTLEKGYNIVSGKLSFEFTKILSPHEVAPTIVATDAHKLAVPVNGGIRKLTINEGLKLFGYPANYSLEFLSENEAFDLLGNTVCVSVITAIAEKLLESMINTVKIAERKVINL